MMTICSHCMMTPQEAKEAGSCVGTPGSSHFWMEVRNDYPRTREAVIREVLSALRNPLLLMSSEFKHCVALCEKYDIRAGELLQASKKRARQA